MLTFTGLPGEPSAPPRGVDAGVAGFGGLAPGPARHRAGQGRRRVAGLIAALALHDVAQAQVPGRRGGAAEDDEGEEPFSERGELGHVEFLRR